MKRYLFLAARVVLAMAVLLHQPKPVTVIHTDKAAAPDGLTAAQREKYYAAP